MKVVMISGSMPPLKCGIGFYTNRLLEALGEKEEVHLFTTTGLDGHSKARNVSYVRNWKIRTVLGLAKKVEQLSPDVIHIQYPAKGYKRELGINLLPLVLKLRRTKAPVVLTLHEYFGSGTLGKTRNFITALFVNKIFVSNPYDLESLPKHLKRKAAIVPIGSNVPVAPGNRTEYKNILADAGMADEKPVIFFGFLFANKGIETLLAAAAKYEIPVLFMSFLDEDDPYQKSLLEKFEEAGKSTKVAIAENLDDADVSIVLQESDIFILPQNFPLTAKSGTAIAAVTHKLVVVSKAADNPDLNEPYVDDKNSILLSDMDVDSLGKTIVELRNAPEKVKSIKKGAESLGDYFSWQNITELHHKMYMELTRR